MTRIQESGGVSRYYPDHPLYRDFMDYRPTALANRELRRIHKAFDDAAKPHRAAHTRGVKAIEAERRDFTHAALRAALGGGNAQ